MPFAFAGFFLPTRRSTSPSRTRAVTMAAEKATTPSSAAIQAGNGRRAANDAVMAGRRNGTTLALTTRRMLKCRAGA